MNETNYSYLLTIIRFLLAEELRKYFYLSIVTRGY